MSSKPTVIDYTLEQFMFEQKHAERVTNTIEKVVDVMGKLGEALVLISDRLKELEDKK